MARAASSLANRGEVPRRWHNVETIHGRRVGQESYQQKKKIFQMRLLSLGVGNQAVLSRRSPRLPLGDGDGPFGRLTGAGRKIPD